VLGEIGATLTEKQKQFAYIYAGRPNAAAAYREAFPGCTEDTCATNGPRLLKDPAVVELVTALRAPILEQYDATAARTIEELSYAALLDPGELYDAEGKLLPVHQMPTHVRRAIASIEYGKFGLKIKLVSKEAAVGLLMRYHGLLKDKTEHSLSESLEALLARSWDQPAGTHA
jgi:hypothetical protein